MMRLFILPAGQVFAFIFPLLAVPPTIAAEREWAAAQQAAREKDYELAVKKTTELINAGQKDSALFYHRGRWNFRLGQINDSLADFDRFIAEQPQLAPRLWERGITCYYAEKFADGSKQFEQYQTYYSNDVENAVWRYLCQARIDGREKARQALLPIKFDGRIPMMEVYELFRGKAKPDAVLKRLEATTASGDEAREQRFNAHLYLALFHDSEGDLVKARRHLEEAVKQYQAGHYMWAVAKQHQRHLRNRAQQQREDRIEKKDVPSN